MTIAKLDERQCILFDLDGTLVDTVKDITGAMNQALTHFNLPLVQESQIRVWVGEGSEKLCRTVLASMECTFISPEVLCAYYLKYYEKDFCIYSGIFSGVIEFLEVCRARHLKMACVTNKPKLLAIKILTQLNLIQYFPLVIGGDSLSEKKPSPMPLLYAIENFAIQSKHVLMIGDSKNDIKAARAAQIDCIIMSYGYNHGESIYDSHPQEVIDNLTQLLNN
ncbi:MULTISPECIES: phosphoglycolate phosphatase [Acinetobacter]|jgi:phosphoglycolate phosphatase|uniref:phosphoglycolate phosphatase n=1 Tax=Acinetobacter pollinis TaxID=2605270 RepID=A0ABU6DSR0_9GAMM|nr:MULTISPECIES: phosphoglycolate phosphatase [Acinetobacter]MBF7691367.1 phosphoglycolate phosphatase [Acinetobacter pollinis]MBF7692737.1 phosphoglycolate phosphatase [Acinetobacter pollinis]MBF7697794.1 phosphoglycolate phosphatase [Acinetobacter pollinis]MBF7700784.1 phosphoglycolate phosphatase [Acinetobacter pollinis]MEB5476740.1 phosphoglycolate phosphatase [Acinetobacter pollinis]